MSSLARGTGARLRAPGVLRWAAGPLCFELVCPHSEVLDRARQLFRPWLNGAVADGAARIRFRIEADGSPEGGWRVEGRGAGEATVAESIDDALAAVEYGAAAAMVAPESGFVSLHAALVSRGHGGVLLVGRKESGKSTLACALLGAGWRLHSDDTVLIEEGARVRGILRRVSLRNASRALLGTELWERILALPGTTRGWTGILFQPAELLPLEGPASMEPVAMIFLGRLGATARPARLERLDAARALLALAPYCNRREAGFGPALEALRPLADRVPAYDLGRGELPRMIARVEETVT